jgi:CheY-like chemotaxis protein
MFLILSVGLNPSLLWKRNQLLKSAGHVVVQSLSLKQAVDRFGAVDPDLILLCHSIPAKDRERLTCLIRASGSPIPVVSVAETCDQKDLFPDATLCEEDESKFLWDVQRVAAKASRRLARAV